MICPNCQQDTLLQGKAKQVCINCGYSQDSSAAAFKAAKLKNQAVVPTKELVRTEVRRVAVVQQASEKKLVKEDVVRTESAKDAHPVLAATQADAQAEPPAKPRPDETTGETRVEFASRELGRASTMARDFTSTYRVEVGEVLGGPIGSVLKNVGIGMGVLLVALLIFTFLR